MPPRGKSNIKNQKFMGFYFYISMENNIDKEERICSIKRKEAR
jgi:hypothetical protein